MNYKVMKPGMRVKCVSAKYGGNIIEMTSLIGSEVTIFRAVGEEEVYIEEEPKFIWHQDDFEPVETLSLNPISQEDFLSLIGL